ncbi:hypothetical protein R3P38DRAFT_2787371 [Favolaschia claudopus]|uniref:Uncharacterized protein n=1 Tax=Favolaschia claudopus TaxID=2862362 RepID=A0AAW0AMP1_9AGAR
MGSNWFSPVAAGREGGACWFELVVVETCRFLFFFFTGDVASSSSLVEGICGSEVWWYCVEVGEKYKRMSPGSRLGVEQESREKMRKSREGLRVTGRTLECRFWAILRVKFTYLTDPIQRKFTGFYVLSVLHQNLVKQIFQARNFLPSLLNNRVVFLFNVPFAFGSHKILFISDAGKTTLIECTTDESYGATRALMNRDRMFVKRVEAIWKLGFDMVALRESTHEGGHPLDLDAVTTVGREVIAKSLPSFFSAGRPEACRVLCYEYVWDHENPGSWCKMGGEQQSLTSTSGVEGPNDWECKDNGVRRQNFRDAVDGTAGKERSRIELRVIKLGGEQAGVAQPIQARRGH